MTNEEIDALVARVLEPANDDDPDPDDVLKLCGAVEQLRKSCTTWEQDYDDCLKLIDRQGSLLTGVVNAIKGEPPELTLWSHHDAPELAAKLREEKESIRHKTITECVRILCCWCEEGHAATYDRGARVWIHLYNDEAGNATCAGTRLRTPPVEEQKP